MMRRTIAIVPVVETAGWGGASWDLFWAWILSLAALTAWTRESGVGVDSDWPMVGCFCGRWSTGEEREEVALENRYFALDSHQSHYWRLPPILNSLVIHLGYDTRIRGLLIIEWGHGESQLWGSPSGPSRCFECSYIYPLKLLRLFALQNARAFGWRAVVYSQASLGHFQNFFEYWSCVTDI
jgi:hypothetical protein